VSGVLEGQGERLSHVEGGRPEAVLHPFGLTNLGQLRPEALPSREPGQGLVLEDGGTLLQSVVVCPHLRGPRALHVADGRSLEQDCLGGRRPQSATCSPSWTFRPALP